MNQQQQQQQQFYLQDLILHFYISMVNIVDVDGHASSEAVIK
jgi:hypothetical protein